MRQRQTDKLLGFLDDVMSAAQGYVKTVDRRETQVDNNRRLRKRVTVKLTRPTIKKKRKV